MSCYKCCGSILLRDSRSSILKIGRGSYCSSSKDTIRLETCTYWGFIDGLESDLTALACQLCSNLIPQSVKLLFNHGQVGSGS